MAAEEIFALGQLKRREKAERDHDYQSRSNETFVARLARAETPPRTFTVRIRPAKSLKLLFTVGHGCTNSTSMAMDAPKMDMFCNAKEVCITCNPMRFRIIIYVTNTIRCSRKSGGHSFCLVGP